MIQTAEGHPFLNYLTLTRPQRRKLPMRWFFDVSKVKMSSFFYDAPPQIFDAHLVKNTY